MFQKIIPLIRGRILGVGIRTRRHLLGLVLDAVASLQDYVVMVNTQTYRVNVAFQECPFGGQVLDRGTRERQLCPVVKIQIATLQATLLIQTTRTRSQKELVPGLRASQRPQHRLAMAVQRHPQHRLLPLLPRQHPMMAALTQPQQLQRLGDDVDQTLQNGDYSHASLTLQQAKISQIGRGSTSTRACGC